MSGSGNVELTGHQGRCARTEAHWESIEEGGRQKEKQTGTTFPRNFAIRGS